MDLCTEKKFIDLRKKIEFIRNRQGIIVSFHDSSDNKWIVKRVIGSGTIGDVVSYKSSNNQYSDLVIKYFKGDSQTALEDTLHEVKIILDLNKQKCKDFIKIGIRNYHGSYLVIMEEIDGDVGQLDFRLFSKPLKIFSNLINFIITGSLCALKSNKVFVDIKSENIGYKFCKNNKIKFTFIDFGSFFDINDLNASSTFIMNKESYYSGEISNKILFIYGTCITFLNIRLAIDNINKMYDFIAFNLDYLTLNKKYRSRDGLLSLENYNQLRKRFYMYGEFNEPFIDTIFNELKKITVKKGSVKNFLNNLQENNVY